MVSENQTSIHQQYDLLFHFSNDGVLIHDFQGNIVKVNGRLTELTGYTQEQLLTMKVHDLHSESYAAGSDDKLRKVMQEGVLKFEAPFLRSDGQIFFADVVAGSVWFEGQPMVQSILRDITYQKSIDQKIKELSRFPEENPMPVIRMCKDFNLEYANKSSHRIVSDWGVRIGDKIPDRWQTIIQEVLSDPHKNSFEYSIDEQVYFFSVSYLPDTMQVYVYGHDVTPLKEAERKLKNASEELNAFIYKASHDIRGPLATLAGLSGIAEKDLGLNDSTGIIPRIKETSERMDLVMQSLIRVAQLSDDYYAHVEPVNFERLMRKLAHDHQAKIDPNRRTRIELTIQGQEGFESSIYILRIVLCQVLANAFEYAKPYQTDHTVTVRVQPHGDNAMAFHIQDNGIGIRDDYREKVFDMFLKANVDAKGLGMGLYIAKKGVEKLRGTIDLKSRLNEGTEVTIVIPNLAAFR